MLARLEAVAQTAASVLIEGESGVGKELVAHVIHARSARSSGPLVKVNCASIPHELFESEFFGHVKGAFTGAHRDRVGRFELADGGTIFLDEVGEIPLSLQSKLLRVLQESEYERVGDETTRAVDVRVIAATNRDLQKMIEENEFREDLWFRLNVIRIVVPPLRERHGDIPLLAHYFLQRSNQRYGQNTKLTESGLRAFVEYTWPGNVRQLEHMIERLSILAPKARIDQEAVADAIRAMQPRESGGESLAETEAEQIRRVLAAAGGNKSRAAKILGIERKTLYRKLERMGLAAPGQLPSA
jgi:transcriptional regulator with PAS, ATPase and Fis domain